MSEHLTTLLGTMSDVDLKECVEHLNVAPVPSDSALRRLAANVQGIQPEDTTLIQMLTLGPNIALEVLGRWECCKGLLMSNPLP